MNHRHWITAAITLAVALPSLAQEHAHHDAGPGMHQEKTMKDPKLPAGESNAKEVLEQSPRHGEFVGIELPGTKQKINTWVVYPERKEKAGVVIVIHEIFGLSDWIRAVADQLAADGFIAIAPDLISGMGPGGGGTESGQTRDDVVKLIRGLSPEETTKRMNAIFGYAKKIPSANGKIATIGFCWGGSCSYSYAVSQPDLNAAVVYYGTSPDSGALATVKAPVLGLYGADDARVNATIGPASKEMKKLGKSYDVEIYDGAGHGFLRQQTGREGANMAATKKAWPRTLEFLKRNL
ncbi:MAG TPA: dienelactone hydrolase family protein [Bacteroidota bacterium]|nr:dienelactone hydrolase family protein [Bacteroidota bacterium]